MEYNLGSVITSATVRKIIYGLYVVAGVFFGAASVGFAATSGGIIPEWVTVGLAVLGYLSIPVGGLALANTGTKVEEGTVTITPPDEVTVEGVANL